MENYIKINGIFSDIQNKRYVDIHKCMSIRIWNINDHKSLYVIEYILKYHDWKFIGNIFNSFN
jgi:hypothetical protein